jgi:hypothetical protein
MSNAREKLDEAYEQRGAKSYHVRNDMDQKRVLVAFLGTSNRRLRERESNPKKRGSHTTIDVVINQFDGFTEVYVPVKDDQKGRLCDAVLTYCQETLRSYARKKPEEGSFKKFKVYRSDKDIDVDTLAEKIYDSQPAKFKRYGVELLPASQCYFSSEAQFSQDLEQEEEKPVTEKEKKTRTRKPRGLVHTSTIPATDIDKIRKYKRQGLEASDISEKLTEYSSAQVAGVLRHLDMGTYDEPMQEVTESLQKKLFKAFARGKTHAEVAEQYGLNRFQAIAQKAQYTRRKNLGEFK